MVFLIAAKSAKLLIGHLSTRPPANSLLHWRYCNSYLSFLINFIEIKECIWRFYVRSGFCYAFHKPHKEPRVIKTYIKCNCIIILIFKSFHFCFSIPAWLCYCFNWKIERSWNAPTSPIGWYFDKYYSSFSLDFFHYHHIIQVEEGQRALVDQSFNHVIELLSIVLSEPVEKKEIKDSKNNKTLVNASLHVRKAIYGALKYYILLLSCVCKPFSWIGIFLSQMKIVKS